MGNCLAATSIIRATGLSAKKHRPISHQVKNMKNNRLFLTIIVSSLLVIATVISLTLNRLQETGLEQVRMQGASITRSLALLPHDGSASYSQHASILHSLQSFQSQSNFAYGVITTRKGEVLAEVAHPGVTVPALAIPTRSSSLFGERRIELAGANTPLYEFYGPIMKDGDVSAFVRVAYFDPGYLVSSKDLSFLGLLALATFTLVPLIYLLIKREMSPLSAVKERLDTLLDAPSVFLAKEQADQGIPAIAQKLSSFLQQSEAKVKELEAEKTKLITSNRLLHYSSKKMNSLLHCLPDGIVVLDPAGHITFANEKTKPLLGIDKDAMLDQPVESWCTDEALRSLLMRFQASGPQITRSDTIEIHPVNLPDKLIRISAFPLLSTSESATFGTLVVLHDATTEHVSRQAGHDFVAHVSHELKSPINTIGMYCEMLQTQEDSKSLRIEATNIIHDEVERMTALINNLLNISKMETGGLRPERSRVRTEDLLQDIYQNLLPRAEAENIVMELDVQKEITALLVDKDMLRIAINNLLTNALKYNRPGGTINLRAQEEHDEVIITVSDTGMGIPREDQEAIFRKFFRVQEGDVSKRSGHGLGLYLANEIVQLHHGRITLESTPGKGSAFSIRLKKSSVANQELSII